MKRVITSDGVVHYQNGATPSLCLCGKPAETIERDLVGVRHLSPVLTSHVVKCPACAKIYCMVKNEPWSSLDSDVLEAAIYAAVK